MEVCRLQDNGLMFINTSIDRDVHQSNIVLPNFKFARKITNKYISNISLSCTRTIYNFHFSRCFACHSKEDLHTLFTPFSYRDTLLAIQLPSSPSAQSRSSYSRPPFLSAFSPLPSVEKIKWLTSVLSQYAILM